MVVHRTLGMSSLAEAEDRSLLRDSKAATGCSWSAWYLPVYDQIWPPVTAGDHVITAHWH